MEFLLSYNMKIVIHWGNKNLVGESTGGGIFPGGGDKQIFR